jgi:hypothetical protein
MTTVTERLTCGRCAAEARGDDQFCVKCGAALVSAASSPLAGRAPIQWNWVVIGAAVIFAVRFCVGLILGVVLVSTGAQDASGAALGSIMLLGFPLGGLIVALMSPGFTIREPAIGAIIPIALFALLSGTESLLSILLAYVLTLGGAKLGEHLQMPRRGQA